MHRLSVLLLPLAIAGAIAMSCSPSPGAPGESNGDQAVCEAASSQDCVCVDGAVGTQLCHEDGSRWLGCVCSSGASCRAGETVACTCDDGRTGERTCADDGSEWSDCVCQGNGGGGGAPCENDRECEANERCDDGQCVPRQGGGGGGGGPAACESDEDCVGDNCRTDMCRCVETRQQGNRCIPACETDDDCPSAGQLDFICNDQGLCRPDRGGGGGGGDEGCRTNRDCERGQQCVEGQCQDQGGGGEGCETNRDCERGQQCVEGQCREQGGGGEGCQSNRDCERGQQCIEGQCREQGGGEGCETNRDCDRGQQCVEGQCQDGGNQPEPPQGCEEDGDCDDGQRCITNPNGRSLCLDSCEDDADCPEGRTCREGICRMSRPG